MPSKFVVLCEGSKCRIYKVRKDAKGNQFVMKKKDDKMVHFCIRKSHPTFSSRSAAMKVQKSLLKDPKACRAKAKSQKKSVKRVPKSKVDALKKEARKVGSKAMTKARKAAKRVDSRAVAGAAGLAGLGAAALAARKLGWSASDIRDLARLPSMPEFQAKQRATDLMETALKSMPGADSLPNIRMYASMLGNAVVEMVKMAPSESKKILNRTKKTVGDMVDPMIPRSAVTKMFDTIGKLMKRAREMETMGRVAGMFRGAESESVGPVYGPAVGPGMEGYVRQRADELDRAVNDYDGVNRLFDEEDDELVKEAPKSKPWWKPWGYGRRRRRTPHYRRTGRFGRQPNTSQMIGFVNPRFDISMAESYTGMRPRAYLRHAMSPTGSPVTMPPGTGVAAANSYYGSYGMGLHLNPQERQPAARFGKKKRKTTKKRKVVRKTVPSSLKSMAKKHGVKLTVKRGDKRVAKSEKELRRQISNKLKAKKTMPKRKVKKSKRKVVKRKAPKRRVKRRTTKFGKRNQFFF